MLNKGLYSWYRRIKEKRPSGQIAAVLTIIIAIIFLFIAITINIGKVSQSKTAVTIATDTAALAAGSGLASFGHYISENQLEGKASKCGINWKGILGVHLIIFGALMHLTPAAGFGSSVIVAGAGMLFNANVLVFPAWVQSANRSMARLTATTALHEVIIQRALFATVDDPEMVVDVNDYDEDDRTDDKISRFAAWSAWRIYMLDKDAETLRSAVSELKGDIFGFSIAAKDMRRNISGWESNWPSPAVGSFMRLLQDVEEDSSVSEAKQGIVYDYIPDSSWELYQASQNVNDLQLKDREGRTRSDNLWYDFTFWRDKFNPDDENDPVNDEVDFFWEDLHRFRYLLDDIFGDFIHSEEEAENTYQFFSDGEEKTNFVTIDQLVASIELWSPALKEFIENTLYDWAKEGGPLERWRAELLSRSGGSLLNKIDNTIEDLEDQIKNDKGLYSGGLQTILEQGAAKLTEEEKAHLNDMIAKLEESIPVLEKLGREEYSSQDPKADLENVYFAAFVIEMFRNAYADFRNKWDQFTEAYKMVKVPEFAEYSWTDSAGPHKVSVEVKIQPRAPYDDSTKIPTIKWHVAWLGFSKCGNLRNYRGAVDLRVTRTDPQEKEVNLAQRLLWIFKSPSITSRSRASYDAMSTDPVRLIP